MCICTCDLKFELDEREKQILRLVCNYRQNKEIAEELNFKLQAVKDRMTKIFRKTGVKSRYQLIAKFRSALAT